MASLTVFAGLKIPKRRSKRLPYGLYKVENLVSLIIALAILFAGYKIAKSALFGGGETMNETLAEQGVILEEGIHADNYTG